MIKFLKEMCLDFFSVQKELNEMGIWHIYTYTGVWSYFDKHTYELYAKKMAEGDHSSTKEDNI